MSKLKDVSMTIGAGVPPAKNTTAPRPAFDAAMGTTRATAAASPPARPAVISRSPV